MALIEWNNDLSVGVSISDSQHKILINMINDLNDAMMQRKGKEAVSSIIDGLLDYTKTHFGMEERYFDQFSYPETASHKELHQKFVQKIVDFKKDFEAGKLGLSIEIMNFLRDWLKSHIQGVDKKYAECFHSHGVN